MAEPDASVTDAVPARERLLEGIFRGSSQGAEDTQDAADDRELARRLVREVSDSSVASIDLKAGRRSDPRRKDATRELRGDADRSFLGQLEGGDADDLRVSEIGHVPTVLSIARAGRLGQRRAALKQLAKVVQDRTGSRDEIRRVTEFLEAARDVELAYELSRTRAELPGAVGRKVRAERAEFEALSDNLREQVRSYWDGALGREPVMSLPGEERAQLLIRVRDLPEPVVAHIAAVLEGGIDVLDRRRRLDLLGALRFASDPRLVAPLCLLLSERDHAVAMEAARALGSVEDARVRPSLIFAFETAVDTHKRAVLAGTLGRIGDTRGADVVRSALAAGDLTDDALVAILEAIGSAGAANDGLAVVPFVGHDDHDIRIAAVNALAQIGDQRVLSDLRELSVKTSISSVRAAIEDAEAAIRARLELRGEDTDVDWAPAQRNTLVTTSAGTKLAPPPRGARFRAARHHFVGRLWMLVRARRRGIARFEAAALARPGWAAPLIAMAMSYAWRNDYSRALAAFRRAVEADRSRVEQGVLAVRELSRCFLRRAEDLEREGRHDIARGLLEEVLALDLRLAPSALRFEIDRLHDALRRRSSP